MIMLLNLSKSYNEKEKQRGEEKNIFTIEWQVIALLQHLIIESFKMENRFFHLSTRYYN